MLPRPKQVLTARECANRRKNKFQSLIEPAYQIINYINQALIEAADRNETDIEYQIPTFLGDYPMYAIEEMEDLLLAHYEKHGYVAALRRDRHVLFLDFGHVEPDQK